MSNINEILKKIKRMQGTMKNIINSDFPPCTTKEKRNLKKEIKETRKYVNSMERKLQSNRASHKNKRRGAKHKEETQREIEKSEE